MPPPVQIAGQMRWESKPEATSRAARRRPRPRAMTMAEALAYWATAPGQGELRPCRLRAARPGRGPGARALLRHQPRHRGAGRPGAGAAEPARGHAGTVPGGRVPVPGEVRLLQRRRGRGGRRRRCSAATCSASTRTRPPMSCRRTAVTPLPPGLPPARAVLAANMETALNAVWDAARPCRASAST